MTLAMSSLGSSSAPSTGQRVIRLRWTGQAHSRRRQVLAGPPALQWAGGSRAGAWGEGG